MYYSKTLLVKQGTFLYEVWPDSAEKRDICNTGILTSGRKSNIEILFIDELLVISENRTLHFSNWNIRGWEESGEEQANSGLTEL